MKDYLLELIKQFRDGAINGFLAIFVGAVIFSLIGSVDEFLATAFLWTILFTGTAKVLTYSFFRSEINIYLEWQIVGLIFNLIGYFYSLYLNINDYYSISERYRGNFIDLFSVTGAIINLFYFSLFQLIFAFVLKRLRIESQD